MGRCVEKRVAVAVDLLPNKIYAVDLIWANII